MADNRVVPTLSEDKYIIEARLKLDRLYVYFLASDYSQSTTYHGEVASLKYLFEKYGDDNLAMVNNVNSTLDNLLSRHFTTVNVHTEVDNASRAIGIDVEVTDSDGVTAKLSNTVKIDNGKINTYEATLDALHRSKQ